MHARYVLDNAKQTVTLELGHSGDYRIDLFRSAATFKDKFCRPPFAAGDLAADDKQVAQVNDFIWRWQVPTP